MLTLIFNIWLVGALAALALMLWANRIHEMNARWEAWAVSVVVWPIFFYTYLKLVYIRVRQHRNNEDAD